MTFIANYATKDAGLSANDAAALVSYTGVASTTGVRPIPRASTPDPVNPKTSSPRGSTPLRVPAAHLWALQCHAWGGCAG